MQEVGGLFSSENQSMSARPSCSSLVGWWYAVGRWAVLVGAFWTGENIALAVEPASAPAWGIGPFVRPEGVNPVVRPTAAAIFDGPLAGQSVEWEKTHTFNPAAVVKDGKVCLLYRAEDGSGSMIGSYTSRLGLAVSEDGLRFQAEPKPVFYPDHDAQEANEWPGGCEDPRLVEGPDGVYVLTYTQWNRKTTHLAVATSKDLRHWEKHGPAFAKELGGKYEDLGAKSGAIVCSLRDGRLQAVKIGGRYWMYWGEGTVRLSSSENLVDWRMVEDGEGKPQELLKPRTGRFESDLAEGGPSPVLTDKGIVVIYNGKNAAGDAGDPLLASGAYADGQALFDANDPTKLLERTEEPFFQPEEPFEMTGQYRQGTTFAEGLVFFQGKWLMYYGCADTFVAVAVADPTKAEAPVGPVDAATK